MQIRGSVVLDALDTRKKDVMFQGSESPEAAGHSNWYTFSQKDVIFQDSDPPEATGHSSA